MGVAHVGLVHRDPCECKVKGFRAVFSIERNVPKRRHLEGVRHAASSGTCLSYFFSFFFPYLLNLPSNTSMRNTYIVCELIAKKALGLHALLAFLQSYLDDSSEVFMHSAKHVSLFGAPHLRGGAWYLDCRPGFTPSREEALFSSLSRIAPVEAVPEEEEAA